jgi:hypothetical protein
MSFDERDYTTSRRLSKLDKTRMRLLAETTRKKEMRVNIGFRADPHDRTRVDIACELVHRMSFAMYCKSEWEVLARSLPGRSRRPRIEEMSSRELYFAQFAEDDRSLVETILAMSEGMHPGDTLTTAEVCEGCGVPESMPAFRSVGKILKALRWRRAHVTKNGRQIWVYHKPKEMLVPPPEKE